ncbi:glycosyltransferase [Shewanella sp. ULN5]|uniref:glycosyltransferase n=1 Tax=Shewanella sp. ULN5 TaxID=2994678 RepID=UPI00273F1DA8|nr:glycosyltransferase [Shewanella sp. ULN5]MDP5145069.1 glycosyltransferase [Shewanella sp. ULN5]
MSDKKLLVVSSRDVFSPGGERNLMENKALGLRELGWDVAYVSLRLKGKGVLQDDFKYRFVINETLVWGMLNIKLILNVISREKPDVIQFSGLWTYLFYWIMINRLDLNNVVVSLDYQGALDELYEFSSKGSLFFRKLLFKFFTFFEKNIYKNVDVIEVVSLNCKKHLSRQYGTTKARFALVPCNLNTTLSKEQYFIKRQYWRSKFNYLDKDIAAVYSGGISSWQCIDDVILFFNNSNIKGMIFTSENNHAAIKQRLSNRNVVVECLSPKVLADALTAFDFGLLPRDEKFTNYVAYPNKFAEYYNARLTILLKSTEIGFYKGFENFCKINAFGSLDCPPRVKIDEYNPEMVKLSNSINALNELYLNFK